MCNIYQIYHYNCSLTCCSEIWRQNIKAPFSSLIICKSCTGSNTNISDNCIIRQSQINTFDLFLRRARKLSKVNSKDKYWTAVTEFLIDRSFSELLKSQQTPCPCCSKHTLFGCKMLKSRADASFLSPNNNELHFQIVTVWDATLRFRMLRRYFLRNTQQQ